ncbi:LysR family transcriptional regulator [Frigidibacter sp. ROC022]|uniref:LysR family transcriptional regulator n=1 Tax=Frigidibacter sp. ROC022 TaxID=2971796 RepID=UPI00215A8171|nr:LysR family transcriptional regulator [Frigidibacter sp. ROC022]MCR8725601.1 LysR family transcriptional regulator [Frigidibacter sp. ROC022]
MDWNATHFDWNRARAFLATAEEGSLSAAARVLGQTQPTLGRQVEAFQQELGLVLFERSGRGLRLTPAGAALRDRIRAMADAADLVAMAAQAQSEDLSGPISISASEVTAVMILPPIIARLRQDLPGLVIDIHASDATSDLRRREADIAIRNFRPKDPDLIARKITDVPARLYASRELAATLGHPTRPDQLNRADFISIDRSGGLMAALNGLGLSLTRANFPVHADSLLVMWECVKRGLGIGVLDSRLGDAEPGVVRVLPDLAPLNFPIWLVAHRELRSSRRLRRVFELLAEELARPPSPPG